MAGAREGGALLEEILRAGFAKAEILRATRNARTRSEEVLAAEIRAVR